MGFSVMLRGAEKLVPAEYWCPYGTRPSSLKRILLVWYYIAYGLKYRMITL